MSRADEDDPNATQRSRSLGAVGAISWGLRAWSAGGLVVPAVIICAAGALVIVCVFAVSGMASTAKEHADRNCHDAIGPDPSASATATAMPASEPADVSATVSATPTANPFASMEPDEGSSAREIACINAFKDAPYYGPRIGTPNRSAAATCAAELAAGQVGRQVAQASLVRLVVYHASTTTLTGDCEPPLPATESSADEIVSTVDLPPASTCPKSTEAMLMPDTLVAQGVCGQPVDVTGRSAGDLVFWDHRDNAPTRVGIAIGPTELVTVDETGFVVRQAIPEGGDVRVKRVLEDDQAAPALARSPSGSVRDDDGGQVSAGVVGGER